MTHLENMQDDIKPDERDRLPQWQFCLFWIIIVILFLGGFVWFVVWLIKQIISG